MKLEVVKPYLIVMCGLQGSGKSTIAKQLSDEYEAVVLSSDALRKDFPWMENADIFKHLYNQMNIALKKKLNVILDATSITLKARKQVFANLKEPCGKVCYIVNTPYEICLERVRERNKDENSHYVPEEVVKRYLHSFEVPFYEEGWDQIVVHNTIGHNESVKNFSEMLSETVGFNQNNKHHTQSLDKHLESVGMQLITRGDVLHEAGLLHDIGKLDTQLYKEGDPNAHYYNHANVGAYKVLCSYTIWYTEEQTGDDLLMHKDTLDLIFYINYHMHMYNIKTPKAEKKWRETFGDIKFDNLILINQADQFNHAGGGEDVVK